MAFTSKFVFTVVNVLMLILVPIHQIEGFPNGAPITACGSMTPSHGVVGQQSPSPFVTVVSDKMGTTNSLVTLELRPSDSRNIFRGYLVLAFDVNDHSKPIGTFKDLNGGKLIHCFEMGAKNAATHSDNSAKISVKLEWNPPSNYSGQVIFRTTFVQNEVTFWVKTESKVVSFIPARETATILPATTTTTPPATATAKTVSVTPTSSAPSVSVKPPANLDLINFFNTFFSRVINNLKLRLPQ